MRPSAGTVVAPRSGKQVLGSSLEPEYLKDKKLQTFRVIHLIEFIQSNNFHIYSECDLKV